MFWIALAVLGMIVWFMYDDPNHSLPRLNDWKTFFADRQVHYALALAVGVIYGVLT